MIEIALRRLAALLPRRNYLVPASALVWLTLVEIAAAQPRPLNAPPAAKDYFLQYLLVGLCIALGLLAALRPSPRKDPEGGGGGWFSMAMGGGHGPETPTRPGERRKTPHRAVPNLILAILGLLGAFTCCCMPFAIVAMSRSKTDLAAMVAGKMDRSGEGLTKVAYYMGIVGTVLSIIGFLWNLFYSLKQFQVI